MVACYEGYEGFCAVLCSCWRNCSPWAAVDIFCTTPWIPIIHTSDLLHSLVWRSLAFAMLVRRAPWRFPGYLWDVESTRRYQDKQANIISQICAMFSTPPLTFCALSPITHRQAQPDPENSLSTSSPTITTMLMLTLASSFNIKRNLHPGGVTRLQDPKLHLRLEFRDRPCCSSRLLSAWTLSRLAEASPWKW